MGLEMSSAENKFALRVLGGYEIQTINHKELLIVEQKCKTEKENVYSGCLLHNLVPSHVHIFYNNFQRLSNNKKNRGVLLSYV